MTPTLNDPAKTLHRVVLQRLRQQSTDSSESIAKIFRHDPLGFVLNEWPWGKPGTVLEHRHGPDANQRQFLEDLGAHTRRRAFNGHDPVEPIRMSISSSHGCGKSTMGAFIGWYILRTRPNSIGTVTAGTYQQLEERTWADICHWGRMAKGAEMFDIQATGIFHRDPKLAEHWKVTPKTASKERSQSFAGQHAANSTSWFLIDEASEVPDENWTPMYGGMTDGEPMIFAWGQMLRNSGEFYRVCFGDASRRWDTRVWDGRNSDFTSKETIEEWLQEYGEDSDWFRVRVRGLPPLASELQFIPQGLLDEARKRVHHVLPDEPLVVGLDAANGGQAKFCLSFRRGLDGKSIPPIFMPGDTPRDNVIGVIAQLLSDKRPHKRIAALFGDSAYGDVILERLRNSNFTNVFPVIFGQQSQDKRYLNERSRMWSEMKEWLHTGAIYNDEKLAQQLMAPGSHLRNGKIVLESKEDMAKRGVKQLDYADATALTFARRIGPTPKPQQRQQVAPIYRSGSMSFVR